MAAATDWWESELFTAPRTGPVVVQFTTEICALCPDATLKIDAVAKTHDFVWHINNAFTSTLAEELEVTALPAILVFHSIDKLTSLFIHFMPPLVTMCLRWQDAGGRTICEPGEACFGLARKVNASRPLQA